MPHSVGRGRAARGALSLASPDKDLAAAVAYGDRGAALLDHDLSLFTVSASGELISRQGPLPSAWQLTSNMLVTETGFVHFALGDTVAAYRLDN